jgi:hypothetical protein
MRRSTGHENPVDLRRLFLDSAGLRCELGAGPGEEILDPTLQEDKRENDAKRNDRDDQGVLDETLPTLLVTKPRPRILALHNRPENDIHHVNPPLIPGSKTPDCISPAGNLLV